MSAGPGPGRAPGDPRDSPADAPLYKGEPLDAERGPGLGCFWSQVVLVGVLLIVTPLSVVWGAPPWVSATLLIVTLVLLLFAGQTVIFLLRLVAADRRSRRRPRSASARPTVGMMEEDADRERHGQPVDGGPSAEDEVPPDTGDDRSRAGEDRSRMEEER